MSDQPKRPPHLLSGAAFSHWLKMVARHGGVDRGFRKQALKISGRSLALTPFGWYESLRYRGAIARTELDPSPVFIIGHWQAGHSLMHYLMSQDPQFGYVHLLHAAVPRQFLTLNRLIRWYLRDKLTATRQVDTFHNRLDAPQAEEFAMAGLGDISLYFSYIFAPHEEQNFQRSVLLEGLTVAERNRWRGTFLWFLRKVAFATGKSRLVLRNGANTGRIPELLAMFPRAKFVHMVRNPYTVYAAQFRRWERMCGMFALQRFDVRRLVESTVGHYEVLMKKYLRDAEQIPTGQLAEVRYEDLARNPVSVLEKTYTELGIPGFETARPVIEKYLSSETGSLAGEEQSLDREAADLVTRHWGFAVERWGYQRIPCV